MASSLCPVGKNHWKHGLCNGSLLKVREEKY
jgi:hypothetical protein